MKKILLLLLIVSGIFACENERDLYYERPDWLKGPLYEQIKSTGEFDEFISLVEYIGYDELLSSRLTFTLFLPTNEAFQSYYLERGISSYKDLDTTELMELVDYHLLENSWDSVKMANKTSWNYWGEIPQNFKTPSFYAPPIGFENNKHIYYDKTFVHLYSTPYMQYFGFTAEDYESFYPGSIYTGYNIERGAILDNQLSSENGYYYVIDKVLLPRTTADKVIARNLDFSIFKSMADIFVRYSFNQSASDLNQNYDSLFNKVYSLNLDLAKEKITDSAPDGYFHVLGSIFVPINSAVTKFFEDNFSAYGGIENVPNIIIKYFVESHLINNKKLYPSVLDREINETNDFSDEIEYTLDDGIVYQDVSSNAIIYGVDRAINSNAFSTVSGPIIKNPEYRIFTMMLELSGEMKTFFKKEIGHVAFVIPDDVMADQGFSYFEGNPIDFTDDRIFLNNSVLSNTDIKNFLEDYISITYKELTPTGEIYVKTKSGNYLKVSKSSVEGVFGQTDVESDYTATNGTVLEVREPMEVTTPYKLENWLTDNKDVYSEFYALCDSAGFVDADGNLTGKLSLFDGVTVLVPTNAAVQSIIGSYIPAGATSDTYNYKALIQYNILSERVMFTDDTFTESLYGTDLYQAGVRTKISASAADDLITIVDNFNNTILITPGPESNLITSNGIIHIVDKVALY